MTARVCEVCGVLFAHLGDSDRACRAAACRRARATQRQAARRQRQKVASLRALARMEDL